MTYPDVSIQISEPVKPSDPQINEPDKNIWSDILKEVQNSTKKTPPTKSIVLLGDNESGRSTLISRMKGVENIGRGIGLEYHFIEVNNEEDRDDTQRLGVWIPDGDVTSPGLLKFALNESNFENTMVVFVVSMSTPWSIMESLKKWADILTEHVNKLNIPDSKRSEYSRQQCRQFQSYQDPDDRQETPATKLAIKEPTDNDDFLLPLDPEILSKNLGIPIMVIVTKSDSISVLDKENDYKIEHFDFIQYHIRRFCLNYGASLFYTTIKDKRTYEKLLKYLTHKMYNFGFNSPSSVVDRESIFIPSGWDNESKINILLENHTTLNSSTDYTQAVPKPTQRKPTQRDNLETVMAIDDQDFLSKLQLVLNKTSAQTGQKVDEPSPQVSSRNIGEQTSSVLHKTPHKSPIQVLKGANPNQPDSTNLKNFFQNLLNKNAPAVTPVTNPLVGQQQVTPGSTRQEASAEVKQENSGSESNA